MHVHGDEELENEAAVYAHLARYGRALSDRVRVPRFYGLFREVRDNGSELGSREGGSDSESGDDGGSDDGQQQAMLGLVMSMELGGTAYDMSDESW